MRLKEWVERYNAEQRNNGALMELKRGSGLSYTTVHAIVHGNAEPKLDSAQRLSAATGGDVTVAEIFAAAVEHAAAKQGSGDGDVASTEEARR